MSVPPEERRQYQRVTLLRALAGKIGSSRVFIVDASLNGLRVAHQGTLPAIGQECLLIFDWEGSGIELQCRVTRSTLHKLAKDKNEKSVYHAGLAIEKAIGNSAKALRRMISDVVARALDEQKANVQGIPAKSAQIFQTGKGTEFLRFELINGAWRRTTTTRADQPSDGFTISAEESRDNIAMLCETFENADPDGRQLIRSMAELSISKVEGIPTRRYTP
ncbi:MAG: PilZ domain-containing protein [Thermoanaerobaculia bacterium]